MQADLLTQVVLPLVLFVIMLGMGLALTLRDFSRVIQAPKAACLGVVGQLVLLPLLGVLIIMMFSLEEALAVGVMILVLCPGGSTSNMISYLAKGDVALSISLTALVSVITPFSIPIIMSYVLDILVGSDQSIELPIIKTLIQLIMMTLVPVSIGMAIKAKWPGFASRIEKTVKLMSTVFMFIVIAGIVFKNADHMADFFVQAGTATLTLNVIAMAMGYGLALLASLNKTQATTLGIEIGIQNGTVALLIASTLLANPVMTIPIVTYSLLMFVTATIFGVLVTR